MHKAVLVSALVGLSVSAFAQTTTLTLPSSTTSINEPVQSSTLKTRKVINKKFEDDQEITDAKMKADSGSLSRYSVKFSLGYYGPPVGDLSNEMQPNPDGSVGTFETALSGSVGARYRIDSKSTISVGTGVSAVTPVQGVKRYDTKNPYISYDRNGHLFDVQMRNSYGMTYVTNPAYREIGEYAGFTLDNSLLYNIGTSRFAVGMDTSFGYYFFERGPNMKSKKEKSTGRYSVAFFPQVKYNFTDKFSTYTSLGLNFNNPRGEEDLSVLWNKILSQRVGFGYAFTRDIYISPYFNFYPKSFTADSTTVNLSTTFSIL
ncbi:MAG: hypothetical protein ACM3MG_01525 [Bacillota bacterium]